PPEPLGDRRGPVARRLLVEEVDDLGVDSLRRQRELGGERVEALRVHVGERERGAVGGKAARDARAEAARSAGDREDAAFKVAHTSLLCKTPDAGPSIWHVHRWRMGRACHKSKGKWNSRGTVGVTVRT